MRAKPPPNSAVFIPVIVLLIGVVAAALSVVFIRESSEPPVLLTAYRVLIAGLVLLPVYFRHRRQLGDVALPAVIARSWLPGIVLAVHFVLWVLGARMTSAANANLLVNLMPIVMPFFMLIMYSERVKAVEVIATLVAVFGLWILTAEDFALNREHFYGDLMCLASMLLFTYYLALARRYKHLGSLWLYVVPVYLIAGLASLLVAFFVSTPFHTYTAYNLTMIFSLALISTVIGHSALNFAMQKLRGQTVSVVNLSQFMIGGICGYFLYQEIPSNKFYFASAWLLLAMGLVIYNQSRIEPDS